MVFPDDLLVGGLGIDPQKLDLIADVILDKFLGGCRFARTNRA